jgi:hypothetical protein
MSAVARAVKEDGIREDRDERDIDLNASLATSMVTSIFPGPPGSGNGPPSSCARGFGSAASCRSSRSGAGSTSATRRDTQRPSKIVRSLSELENVLPGVYSGIKAAQF